MGVDIELCRRICGSNPTGMAGPIGVEGVIGVIGAVAYGWCDAHGGMSERAVGGL